jgi:hypothetical protein
MLYVTVSEVAEVSFVGFPELTYKLEGCNLGGQFSATEGSKFQLRMDNILP